MDKKRSCYRSSILSPMVSSSATYNTRARVCELGSGSWIANRYRRSFPIAVDCDDASETCLRALFNDDAFPWENIDQSILFITFSYNFTDSSFPAQILLERY